MDMSKVDIPSAEELEEHLALPDATPGDKGEEKSEPEWVEQCRVRKHSVLIRPDDHSLCSEAVVVNVTLACPFCGLHTWGLCDRHKDLALSGVLGCLPCTKKAGVQIEMKPVNAIWKQD